MTITTLLKSGTVYVARDRLVCIGCAGYAAAMTGRDIDGHKLREVDEQDRVEWKSYDLGPLTCECGSVTAR
jgi:hypothetical protein